jgi:hypothetical protein
MTTLPLIATRLIRVNALLALAGALLAPLAATQAADSNASLSLATDKAAGLVEISYADKPVLVYAYGPKQFKPYVKALYTLKGDNVLLDAPSDHLHHHGLMYAIMVNGVNFWEEATDPGYERSPNAPEAAVNVRPDGTPQALIAQQLFWVATTNAQLADPEPAALLIENRTLIVSVNASREELSVQWQSDFKVGPHVARATLSGADYHGLGVRFPRSWDRVARHVNSENAPYPTQGKHDVLEARWSAVANTVGGREQMLAVFTHPDQRGPSKFFSMLDPFAYLSATQGLDKTKLEYAAGSTFRVRYLVTVYPAIKPPEFLATRCQEWLKGQ